MYIAFITFKNIKIYFILILLYNIEYKLFLVET